MPVEETKHNGDVSNEQNRISILNYTQNSWEVEVFFPTKDTSEFRLSEKFKEIKDQLTAKYEVPSQLIRYKSLLGSKHVEGGTLVHLEIEKISTSKGAPILEFRSALSPESMPYSDMECYACFRYLDEFEKELTEERISQEIKRAGIPQEFVDWDAIKNALTEVKKNLHSLDDVLIARGKFPDVGRNAEIEMYFKGPVDKDKIKEYVESRKVTHGAILCTKRPPEAGKESGMTVRGRVIPPGQGFDIELVAGKNVHLNMEETKLTAKSDGIVLIERESREILTPDGEKTIPSKIIISIDELTEMDSIACGKKLLIDNSIKIKGTVDKESQIISEGAVQVDGNISDNVSIKAAQDITVNGKIDNSEVVSGKSVISSNDITNSKVSAGENLITNSQINSSEVSGKEVHANSISKSKVTVRDKVVIDRFEEEGEDNSAIIFVGADHFLGKKIKENEQFIQGVRKKIDRLKKIFGEDTIKGVRENNVQQMFFKFLSENELSNLSKHKIDDLKRLLYGVPDMLKLMKEKKNEIKRLERQSERQSKSERLIIVKEKVSARPKIHINKTILTLEPQDGPLEINVDELGEYSKND